MEDRTTYRFKMNQTVPRWKKFLAVGVAAVLFAIPLYFVGIYINEMAIWWPTVILIATVILNVVVYYAIVADRQPLNEVIRLHTDSIDSKHFGKISFADILYCQDQTGDQRTSQLEIRLTGGKTKKWQIFGPKITKEDQQTLYNLVQTLARKRNAYIGEYGKTFPRDYEVTHMNPRGLLYGLLCFLFIPVLLIPNINSWGFWIFPMILIPLVGGIILLIKQTIRKDHVVLFETHLQSTQKGRIAYDEIDTIITAGSKMNPGLTLILRDGKKVKWRTLNFGTSDRKAAIRQNSNFWHFIQDLAKILDETSVANDEALYKESKKTRSTRPEQDFKAKPTRSNSTQDAISDSPSASQNRSIKHIRGKKARYIGIPVSLIVGILLLARTCDFQDNPIQDAAENSQQSRREALQLIKGFTKKNGPYLLFTNDKEAKLYSIPEKKTSVKTLLDRFKKRTKKDYVPQKLRNINAGFKFYKTMRYAQLHPDSVNWHMTIIRKNTTISVGKSPSMRQESVAAALYIATYTPKVERPGTLTMKAYRRRKGLPDSTDRKLHFVLPIHQNQSLKENVEKLPHNQLDDLLKSFKEYPKTSQLYVVGKIGNDGMSRARFKQLVDQLQLVLTEQNIDTTNFQIKEVP